MSVRDVPVTQKMLYGVRDELIERMDSKFAAMDGRFSTLEAAMHDTKAIVSRIAVLVEEQNARNAVVMEAIRGMSERQDRTDARVDRFEDTLHSLVSVAWR